MRAASAPAAGSVVINQNLPANANPSEADSDPGQAPSFWEQVASVPEGDWWDGVHGNKGTKAYLYYDQPGSPYICVICEPFDIEWVRDTYGGGRYRAQLNGPSGRCISSIKFMCEGPPKKKPPQSVDVQTPALPGVDPFQAQVLRVMEENNRQTRELLMQVMHRNGPAAQGVDPTVQFQAMVTMFGNLIPKPADPIEQFLKLKQLLGDHDVFSQLAKFKELGLIGNTAGEGMGGILGQLDLVMKVAERMGISGGGGGKSIPEMLMEKGPDIVNALAKGIKEYRELEEKRLDTARFIAAQQPRQIPPAPQPVPGQPAPPQPMAQPAPKPGQTAAPPSPPATPLQVEPISVPPGATGAAVAQLSEAQIQQVEQQIVQAIANNTTGADLFGYLNINAPVLLNGMCVFDGQGRVVDVVTEDQLALFCSTRPILAQAAQYPNFRQVLRELLSEIKYATLGIDDQAEAPDQEVR